MKTINQWAICADVRDRLLPTEYRRQCLYGIIEGSPKRVLTSDIVGRRGINLVTQNEEYILGTMNEESREKYPDILERIMKFAKEV